ncbi:MAG: c-type cytochrome [Alphaproteobacteria bacterium]|nr:c-type cytochrome [Alphaproteobacteria bacterium]
MSGSLRRGLGLAFAVSIIIATAIGLSVAQSEDRSYGQPRAEATEVDRKIFADGLKQFSRAWDEQDGAGARFNEHSCLGCHATPAAGGSGTRPNMFVVVSNEISDSGGGHVFQRLQRTAEGITALAAPAGASRRKPPPLFGLGLLDGVDLQQPATPPPGPDKIIGRVGGTVAMPGRFGWKARVPDIETFVQTAFTQELGLDRKPDGQTYPDIAIEEIAAFVRLLGPPPKRALDERAKTGERLFGEIGCVQCHTPSLKLTQQAADELEQQPEIRAYTDLLLHDMGPGLADGISEGRAGPADFRTAPLWGVGASGPPYLHDGRARDLPEAIGLHNGEARNARLRWEKLSPEERDALIRFLQSL